MLLYEFKADLNKYLAGARAERAVKSLKEAIAFNEAHKDREMPFFGQEIFEMAEKKGPLTDAKYLKALEELPAARADARHRRRDDAAQARRARLPDRAHQPGSPTS